MSSKISTRTLGNAGIQVGRIGLGCMGMTSVPFAAPGTNESISREPWFDVMKKAIERGCNLFNTGEFYGDNELVLKEFFEKNPQLRNEVFISVKAGVENLKPNGNPEFLKSNIDFNLNKFGVSKIDLYQMARVDPNVPIEVSVKAIAECIKEGKVGHIGLSEASEDTIRRAHKIHPIACVEVEYSLWSLDIETNGVKKACEELGIAIIAYSPLGRGFLVGKFKSEEEAKHAFTPRVMGENFDKNLPVLKAVEALADKHKVTPAQLCLAWVLAQSPLAFPIPGTTKTERLIENLDADKIILSQDDLAEVRKVIESQNVHGDRYPEHHAHLLFGSSKPLEGN